MFGNILEKVTKIMKPNYSNLNSNIKACDVKVKIANGSLEKLRKLTEELIAKDYMLKESENKYRTLLDNVQEGIWVIDQDSFTTFANDRMADMLGYTIDEMIGRHIFNFIRRTDREEISTRLERRKFGLKSSAFEMYLVKKDGSLLPVILSSAPIFDEFGVYKSAIAGVMDISEKRDIENALQKVQDKYSEEVKSLAKFPSENPSPVFRVDKNGNLLYANDAALEYFRCWNLEIGREVIPLIKDIVSEALTSSTIKNIDTEQKGLIFSLSVVPINESYVNFYGRDVTDRRKIEQVLREKERFWDDVFKSIKDGISVLDMDFNIVAVNPTMERWYAHSMPLVGKKCWQAYHLLDKPCDICPVRRSLNSRKCEKETIPLHGPSKEVISWLEVYSYPYIDQETKEFKGVIEYVRDAKDRILLQQLENKKNETLENKT